MAPGKIRVRVVLCREWAVVKPGKLRRVGRVRELSLQGPVKCRNSRWFLNMENHVTCPQRGLDLKAFSKSHVFRAAASIPKTAAVFSMPRKGAPTARHRHGG